MDTDESGMTTYRCLCRSCGQKLEFPIQMTGLQIACPTCGEQTLLKDPYQGPPPVPKFPESRDYAPRDDIGTAKCRVCGKIVSPSADICPHCGEREPGAKVQCRYCGSGRVTVSNAQVLSYGKAAVATMLLGPVGLLAGLLPANHTFCRCLDCGKSF
jgi:DNA-directed RNA polymerase subunit RPC12/RpoP